MFRFLNIQSRVDVEFIVKYLHCLCLHILNKIAVIKSILFQLQQRRATSIDNDIKMPPSRFAYA